MRPVYTRSCVRQRTSMYVSEVRQRTSLTYVCQRRCRQFRVDFIAMMEANGRACVSVGADNFARTLLPRWRQMDYTTVVTGQVQ